jgi:hypothetical protein
MLCRPQQVLLSSNYYQINMNEMGGASGKYGGKGKVRVEFWWGNLMERGHLENRLRWDDNIKIDLKQVG